MIVVAPAGIVSSAVVESCHENDDDTRSTGGGDGGFPGGEGGGGGGDGGVGDASPATSPFGRGTVESRPISRCVSIFCQMRDAASCEPRYPLAIVGASPLAIVGASLMLALSAKLTLAADKLKADGADHLHHSVKREIHPDGGGHGKNFAHRHKRRHHPEDKLSGKDCWIPDYCDPDKFEYRVCKLRLRNRKGKDTEWACPDGYFCEELDCENKCWLPSTCTCHPDGHEHEGRMVCSDDCYQKQSTQWGLCVPEPEGWDGDDDEPLPAHFHFWSADHLLYNAKLHLNEDSPMHAPHRQHKDEL